MGGTYRFKASALNANGSFAAGSSALTRFSLMLACVVSRPATTSGRESRRREHGGQNAAPAPWCPNVRRYAG